jgi:signal peptidase I
MVFCMRRNWSRIPPLLLSFVLPGLGQLYKGEGMKAVTILLLSNLIGLAVFHFGDFDTVHGLLSTVISGATVGLPLFLWCLWDSWQPRRESVAFKWYTHWYSCIAFCVLYFLAINTGAGYVRSHFFNAFKMSSSSLMPTIRPSDFVFVSTRYYKRHPVSHGDVVVFERPNDSATPTTELGKKLLKRVIALPGENVEVRGTQVLLNGVPISEPYAHWENGGIPEGNFPSTVVPPGKVFLLGDNRNHSKDSRFWTEPFVPIQSIEGKALYIYWSHDSQRIGTTIR